MIKGNINKHMSHDSYISPLSTRYASQEMQKLFSDDYKFTTFHRLWIALAKAEQKLGLPITNEQIDEMCSHINDIDYTLAGDYEKKLRHDVMAHIHAWGDICTKARPIIHLGATSCFVGDNTDILIMHNALKIIRAKVMRVIKNLSDFAQKYKDLPCLAYTHLQPAQLTTVGKRTALYIYDLILDIQDLDHIFNSLALLGNKGTTGTQASFMELFEGDENKVNECERLIANELGLNKVVPVSGQTYSRKFDFRVLSVLSGVAQSAYKFASDLRILQSFKEMEEPFEQNQIGSSAMPYKRNPMRSERICALARFVINDLQNPAMTVCSQWFERTLDDSANKRLSISEAFLGLDAILNIFINVSSNLVVYPKVINKRVMAELPFIASENILMEAVKKGGDRQELHEKIRKYSIEAGKRVKEEGLDNNLLQLIANDKQFKISMKELQKNLKPENYTGRASSQVNEFLKEFVEPLLSNVEIADGIEITV